MPNAGTYSEPRRCSHCSFATVDRSAYWSHRLAHESFEEALRTGYELRQGSRMIAERIAQTSSVATARGGRCV